MASSTFTFVDQNGKPVWGLATRIARNNGDTNAAEDERYPDKSGKTTFLEVKKVLPASGGYNIHVNYNEGLNPDWQSYEPLSKHIDDIEDPAQIGPAITIQKKNVTPPGPVCPKDHNKQQFNDWFFDVTKRLNQPICTNAALLVMKDELIKCGMRWQNQDIYTPDKWRPRIFQAPLNPPPISDSEWAVDCGDYGSPWKLTFRY